MRDNMQAISTIFPVFFILFLGIYARKKGWINHEQNNGLKTIALDILFPFLIYHIVAGSVLDRDIALEIIYLNTDAHYYNLWQILWPLSPALKFDPHQ